MHETTNVLTRASSLAQHERQRLPQPGCIIASSYTSPIDALYLAAIFDATFTASYPNTRRVERLSLLQAIMRAFQQPRIEPGPNVKMTDLPTILKQNPKNPVVVFPECVTTNGRGILLFSGSLLTAPTTTKIFPISLRYTAADITTPVPGSYFTFIWNLLSQPTHCIRVRIAESVTKASLGAVPGELAFDEGTSSSDTLLGSEHGNNATVAEMRLLERVATALARLGKSKRLGLGVRDKMGFSSAYSKR